MEEGWIVFHLDGNVVKSCQDGGDEFGIGVFDIQECSSDPTPVEVCNIEGVCSESGGTDGDEKGHKIVQWLCSSCESQFNMKEGRVDLRSPPNGIWNISEIHGNNHAPKLDEKYCQLISPNPPPHSTRHCS